MNVTDVFDTVLHSRLIHNLRKYRISQVITNQISSFLTNRVSIFFINDKTLEIFKVRTRILQEFSISSILYLFYNVDLLDINNRLEHKTNAFDFVDDINLLTFSQNTEENYKCLEQLHIECSRWIRRHDVIFTLYKYELIHLIHNSKKFNMKTTIRVKNISIIRKTDIRVLEL